MRRVFAAAGLCALAVAPTIATADTTTTFPPFSATIGYVACAPNVAEGVVDECSFAGDPNGPLSLGLRLVSGMDGIAPGHGSGFGLAAVVEGHDVSVSTSAIRIEATIHIDTMAASHSGVLTGTVGTLTSLHGFAYGRVLAFARISSCSACGHRGVIRELVRDHSPAGTPSGITAQDFTLSITLRDPSGNPIPPGTVELTAGIDSGIRLHSPSTPDNGAVAMSSQARVVSATFEEIV